MELTKYQHACFTVELDGQTVLIDPGNLTQDLNAIDGLVAIVITHQHPDHCDAERIKSLSSSDIPVYAHRSVLENFDISSGRPVESGDTAEAGPFQLKFFGGDHAVVHQSVPVIPNLGLSINGTIFYPGDSFAEPESEVEVLMLPVSAPWMKLAEAIDYANRIRPGLAIPTHDAILSGSGQEIVDGVVKANLLAGINYRRLNPAQTGDRRSVSIKS